MKLDQFTLVLLTPRDDAPEQSDADAAATQDAHLSYLADLHDAGRLLAAGPMRDEDYNGACILDVEPERARELMAGDPAVGAGWFTLKFVRWLVPSGVLTLTDAPLPRSVADVRRDS